jgi:hypothetical protein
MMPSIVVGMTASSTADIPAGHSFAEGGGGPLTYTFREEWRRARDAARAWRPAAYLVSASGNYVNDDGVPSYWTMDFVDRPDPDAALVVEIDPWGKVTGTHVVTSETVSSLLGPHATTIPYGVIDSDQAVGLGEGALKTLYNPAKTNSPSIALRYSEQDGSGPYWTYTLFYQPSAQYVSAQINAISGDVLPLASNQ